MPKRDFVHTTDFERADYEEVFRRAAIFEKGILAGENFTHLLPGRVLASMFLKESTRTMTTFQSAMVRLGGGWTGLTGTAGTYLATGEEDIGDIVASVAEVADIMALRYNDCDPVALAKLIDIPLINGMCGGEEHASGALALMYPVIEALGSLQGKKIGMYGMVSASRPMSAVLSVGGALGAEFYLDTVLPQFKPTATISEICLKRGGSISYAPMEEWMGEVDLAIWVEGLPVAGTPEDDVNAFNEKLHIFTNDDILRLKDTALFVGVMPRATTDGRLVMAKETDYHERNITLPLLKRFQYVAMGLMTYLLEVEVK
ncbi:MAG: hypothetical protein COW24_01925 [Candidatus Kerfeldbacteria bacterium CG15_BIG_FIL_POST_REV_8_21_14_020_45_12]|uniref:Aspartate/ornithine carbamoyltransferase carbamoyl-P binding domain-containing protein n=1 Tax=Candidatus Kerfeldbacteria bacterium CG15_BIG_FIL_POST_REV_8_21_14_020_45_12 TaxID=2014247 RepID=A0A2M7H4C9_9BACT|nr:MAG: hypothetical protein COW24_01925 [Candidatus Kerfeldbacteria bacterium CG15_BIG_FIL_POST_REV_8_21_14_020_45_12]PJA93068.1 MAG: hypothetical protein CO132_04915 [Candidatus Kerfeldbacteria bacterium CG_4_9_14_3_um_filter_45_8]